MKFEVPALSLKSEESNKRIRDTVPFSESHTAYGGILSQTHRAGCNVLEAHPQDMAAELDHLLAD
jgi:hypothetical protein